jgi:peptide/nickel transport system ATP-binding protein
MGLSVTDLEVTYSTPDGPVHAINDVSFRVNDGINYGLIGESGCGKSTVAEAIVGLLPENAQIEAGTIEFNGRDLHALSPESRRDVRWAEIAYIPQSAMDALDPVMTTGEQITQAIRTNRNISKASARTRATELFEVVGLEPTRLDEYPHAFSGGMRQRVVIAMALALDPDLIIADEPANGVDAIAQDTILDQILDIQERSDSSLLLITHDIGTVAETCDEFSVFYGGRVMEQGSVDNVLLYPTNPYTMGLKNSFPAIDEPEEDPVSIPGTPPDLGRPPSGCVFVDRCPFATEECEESRPELTSLPARNQRSACHHLEQADRMRRAATDLQTWEIQTDTTDSTVGEQLLRTDSLTKLYEQRQSLLDKLLGRDPKRVRAAHDVSLSVSRSEILGIAGESGCGKSTLAETIALLREPTNGRIVLDGKPHEYYRGGNMMEFRQKVQIVFQNPYDALNPRMTVGRLVGEPLSIHDCRTDDRKSVIVDTLERVGLVPGDTFLDKYPHQLSGGERQRVAIARALVLEPELLICDEPASMLDVSLKVNLLNLLRRLADERGLGVLYISHDLASLTQVADRLAIMYLGCVVEKGDTEDIVRRPNHPYTNALLSAVPKTDPSANRDRVVLDGEPPDPVTVPDGCSFANRCPRAADYCTRVDPELTTENGTDHPVACHYPSSGGRPEERAEPSELDEHGDLDTD